METQWARFSFSNNLICSNYNSSITASNEKICTVLQQSTTFLQLGIWIKVRYSLEFYTDFSKNFSWGLRLQFSCVWKHFIGIETHTNKTGSSASNFHILLLWSCGKLLDRGREGRFTFNNKILSHKYAKINDYFCLVTITHILILSWAAL